MFGVLEFEVLFGELEEFLVVASRWVHVTGEEVSDDSELHLLSVRQSRAQALDSEDLPVGFELHDALEVVCLNEPLVRQLQQILNLRYGAVNYDGCPTPLLYITWVVDVLFEPEMLLECVMGLAVELGIPVHDDGFLDEEQISSLHEVIDDLREVHDVLRHHHPPFVETAPHF